MSKRITAESKFIGCFLGGAIGDAKGRPFEFLPRQVRRADLFGNSTAPEDIRITHPLDKLPPNSYTDDTFLNLAQIKAYTRKLPIQKPEESVRKALKLWYAGCQGLKDELQAALSLSNEEVERYATRLAGTTTLTAARAYYEDPKRKSVAASSNSCGPLVRIAPFLLGRHLSDEPSIGDLYSMQTHIGARVRVATVVVAHLVKFMFERTTFTFEELKSEIELWLPEQILAAFNITSDSSSRPSKEEREIEQAAIELYERYSKMLQLFEHGSIESALSFGTTSDAFDVLLSVIAILFVTKGDFVDTAQIVSLMGGDADSIGYLACSLAGLLKGNESIPQRLKDELDGSLQLSSEEIEALVVHFYAAVVSVEQVNPATFVFTSSEDPDYQALLSTLRSSPTGFISLFDLLQWGTGSTTTLLRRLDSHEKVIISDTGAIYISNAALKNHPVCLRGFIENSRGAASDALIARKRETLAKKISSAVSETTDTNEKWRLLNLLELVGSSSAISLLEQHSHIGREKGSAIQHNLVWDYLKDLTSTLRDSSRVPERRFYNSCFLVTEKSADEFLKEHEEFALDACHPTIEKLDELAGSCRQGGYYIISYDGSARGPLLLKNPDSSLKGALRREGFPLPIAESFLQELCCKESMSGALVYPRRNALVTFMNGKVSCVSRTLRFPDSLRPKEQMELLMYSERLWKQILNVSKRVPPSAVSIGVSLVMDAILNGDHGCSVCVLSNADRYLDRTEKDKWLSSPISLKGLDRAEYLQVLRAILNEDGATFIKAEEMAIVAYGQKFSNRSADAWKRFYGDLETANWLTAQNRGMRHLFAAMYAKELKGHATVIVGSERGDISIFGQTGRIALLGIS